MNKITVNKLPKSRAEIKVEIPAEEFEVFVDKALNEFVQSAEIPGFRKGGAPKEMVKAKVGMEKILDRAAANAIEITFPQAVAQEKLEPLGYPEISVLKLALGNPLEYKATISLWPRVDLPDYKKIASEFKIKPAELTQEEIARLKAEKERHEREHLRQDALEKIAQGSAVEIPDVLIQRETQNSLAQLKENTPRVLNMAFEDYLKKLGKTEAELAIDITKENEAKIKNYLVLEEIAKKENIAVGEEEIAAAIKNDKSNEGGVVDEKIKEYYRQTLKTEKVFEFLETNFKK